MSAILLNAQHIAAIVGTAFRRHGYNQALEIGEAQHLAEVLALENARSYGYRYADPTDCEIVTRAMVNAWMMNPLSAVEAIKALDSYEYQSCECDDWSTSAARILCIQIRGRLCRQIPGYSDADSWTIHDAPAAREMAKRQALRAKVRA